MTSILDIYPRYSYGLLECYLDDFLEDTQRYLEETDRGHWDLPQMFDFDAEYLDGISGEKAVVVSLFFKPVGFGKECLQPKTDAEGMIPLSELQNPDLELFRDTPRGGKSFIQNYVEPLLEGDFRDWQVLVFLAHDLQVLKPILKRKGMHVIVMKHSSVGHSPGAMWRYLSFNLGFENVYFQDSDSLFDPRKAEALVSLASSRPEIALARRSQRMPRIGELALIPGRDFVVRPRKMKFEAKRAMLGYIVLNLLREEAPTNFPFEPRGAEGRKTISREVRNRGEIDLFDPIRPFGKTLENWIPRTPPGDRPAGKVFPHYFFDEQWLKEFVYYEVSDGRMATLARSGIKYDTYRALDLEFQESRGNLVRYF